MKIKHYGVDVKMLSNVRNDFEYQLKQKGIEYEIMPIVHERYKVIRFYGSYAIIHIEHGVFITEQLPGDLDFEKLVDDCIGQFHGHEPKKMETHLHSVIRKYEIETQDAWYHKHIDNLTQEERFIAMCKDTLPPPIPRTDYIIGMGKAIMDNGYNTKKLDINAYWDVSPKLLAEIIDAWDNIWNWRLVKSEQ